MVVAQITFNLHELDDPSAISRFLLEYDIYDVRLTPISCLL